MQNIGEVARSDGGVEKTGNSSDNSLPAVSRNITGCFRRNIGGVPVGRGGVKQKRPLHVCNEYSHTPPLCFVMQNIGEVARSDGGVEKTDNSSDKVKPPLSAVSRSITGCFRKEIYFVPLFFNDKLYFLCP